MCRWFSHLILSSSWYSLISAEEKLEVLLSFSSSGGMYKSKRQVPDPVGGLEFLPISFMKVSNYSTRQRIFPNLESYLESGLRDYWILLLEYLWETPESLLSLVWLGLLDEKLRIGWIRRDFWCGVYYLISVFSLTSNGCCVRSAPTKLTS